MARTAPLTEEQLRAAWQQRTRASWPATFEEAMAHPLLSGLVRATAIGRAQALARQCSRPTAAPCPGHQQPAPAPVRRAAPPAVLRPQPQHLFDPKRLAAGDRDDD